MWKSLFTVVLCVLLGPSQVYLRPKYIDCQDSSDCGGKSCCVLGVARYSIPHCESYREVGDSCIDYNLPYNTTLTYPDGEVVVYTNVFRHSCHCSAGLTCDTSTATCYDPSIDPDFNFLK